MSKFQNVYLDLEKVINMKNRITNVLKTLLSKRKISSKHYKDFSPSFERAGIIYGLEKCGKIAIDMFPSFQPILLDIGTQTCKTLESLVPYLGPLTTNGYTVKDSFAFAEQLESSFESSN